MRRGRLLFHNDARHYHMYCYEPPMSLEEARAPVDEIAGTGVDTLVYGFGAGPTMMHLTEVGEILGTRLSTFKDLPDRYRATLSFWRAYEHIMSLKERGLDILTLLVERAHEKGLQIYGSLRLNHPIASGEVDANDNWQFRVDHPEWCLRGRGKHNFNFVYPEVRAERLALIEEAVNRYDLDGFELEFAFSPYYFEEDGVEQNTPVMTEYVREIRDAVEKAAEAHGRPIALGAKVLPTLAGNVAAGLDVPAWIGEGLLDFVVPNFYIDHQIDADFPFEWLVELARSTGCQVFPALQSRVGRVVEEDVEPEGERMAGPENYWAGALAYWEKGADGIYLPWFNWPIGAQDRQVLSEINDPELLRDRPKQYAVRRHDDNAASHGFTAQLPLTLTTGLDAPGQTVRLFVADDPENVDATLRVRLRNHTSHDSLTVSVNGKPLPEESGRLMPHGYTPQEAPVASSLTGWIPYSWLEYPLARGALSKGHNEVGVALHERPRNLLGVVMFDCVELSLTHR